MIKYHQFDKTVAKCIYNDMKALNTIDGIHFYISNRSISSFRAFIILHFILLLLDVSRAENLR